MRCISFDKHEDLTQGRTIITSLKIIESRRGFLQLVGVLSADSAIAGAAEDGTEFSGTSASWLKSELMLPESL